MADYYGSCTGKAGAKYNLWLNVVQNYQSVEGNSSNVSVSLFLKRNDGQSSSAYNLNEWENSASITINGETKVWRNLEIDTRGNATVTLAQWMGDVYHNADGTLSLNIDGSFTMGNSNVSGGQVIASFTCTTIPRTSYMTLSASEVYFGGNVECNVYSASSEFSHSIKFQFGNTEGSLWLSEGITNGIFTLPLDWANQMPWSTSANVTVVLTTYYYGQYVGANSYSIKVVVPDTIDFKPTFDLVAEKLDNGVPSEWNVYLKGVSGIKLDIANLNLKYGAVVTSCEARVGNVTYNSVPSWFYLHDVGNVDVSVTVRDSRGFTCTIVSSVFVTDYHPPHLTVNSIKRCNSQGELSESGDYFLLDYNADVSGVDGKNQRLVSYRCGTSNDNLGDEIFINTSPAVIGNGVIIPSRSYTVRLCVYDSVYWWGVVIDRSVPSADIPFNIRRGGTGASFGCYSETDNELTVGWDLDVKGKLKTKELQLTLSENISNVTDFSKIRYYPCLDTCFINLGVINSIDIPANVGFIIGYTPVKPLDFAPLNAMTGEFKGGYAYVDLENNAIVFKSNEYVSKGAGIYINGFYTTRQEE